VLLLAIVAYVPLLLTHRGMVGADTKLYLYLDPSRMLARAASMWDPSVGMGTVTHENIGYLMPMGPFYWILHALSVPTWIAQRLWTGSLLFFAGLGVAFLLRTIGWRGRAVLVAALAYMLSPYLLEYVMRESAILMPWSALPWLIGLTLRALRHGGWRAPAMFAIVAALAGSVNASSLIYAGLGPVLLLPYAVWVTREVRLPRAVATAARIGVLTLACSAWWISGLATQAGYGMNVLRFTETVRAVSADALPIEALRGLGNWYFYGTDQKGPWITVATYYTEWLWLLAVSFAVPFLAFVAACCIRWRYKLYFVLLIVTGVALTTLVHPYAHPSPVGSVFKGFANTSTFGLALRSTPRAVPLVALGVAVLLGGGLHAFAARFPAKALLATVAVVGLVVADMFPLWTGNLVDNNLQRPQAIPSYWTQATAYLNSLGSSTRVLEEPGADFSYYNWGVTLDPVTPGLMDRPFVGRELIPYGSPPSADLLIALDRRLQEGTFEPSMLAPVASLMSAGNVLLRSDLQTQQFNTPRPRPTWALFSPATPAGLVPGPSFGGPAVSPGGQAGPKSSDPPNIATFTVPAVRPIIRAESTGRPMIVAGDGDGLVDLGAAGLLGGDATILYAASLDRDPAGFASAMANGADLVLTDSNRRRAWSWGSVRDNTGYTERAGEQPLVSDPTDNRLIVFPGAGDDAATVTVQRGGLTVSATSYGNNSTYVPGDRAANALDGDLTTAWRTTAGTGEALHVDLAAPMTTDHINLVQPLTGQIDHVITSVTLRFDGGRSIQAALGPSSRTAAGQTLRFPRPLTFQHLVIQIDGTARLPGTGTANNGVGFAAVRLGDHPPVVDEIVRLPVDLLDQAGAASVDHRLTLVLTRLRSAPSEAAFKPDDEPELKRMFTLPTARSFSISGEARVNPNGAAGPASQSCRTDLLEVDGKPVPLRISALAPGAGAAASLQVQGCGQGATLTLSPGDHVLEAAPGHVTGIDLDRLVLASERGGGPVAVGPDATVPVTTPTSIAPSVRVVSQGRTSATVDVDVTGQSGPFWLVLGQSFNAGWSAHADGVGNLGAPQLVDGLANGWLVRAPAGASHVVVRLDWTPQHRVRWGIAISVLAALLCLLLGLPWRRRRPGESDGPMPQWAWTLVGRARPASRRTAAVLGVVATLLAAGLIGPVPGVAIGMATFGAAIRPRLRPALAMASVAGVGVSALYVVYEQLRHHFHHVLNWAALFERTSAVTWVAIALMAAYAGLEHLAPRRDSRSGTSSETDRP
jgi:hypothetical protein